MPKCGSQCWFCDMPVRYDTYRGCTHACKYCFAQRKADISKVKPDESIQELVRFVNGERKRDVSAFDWNIPLHIGGMSDPLQPCERQYGRTKEALKVLADSGYPYVMSTKGALVADPEYLSLIKAGNAVIQISMACSKYDKIEQGAPNFEKRLKMLNAVAPCSKRAIVRVQPYFHDCFPGVLRNMKRFAEAGAYGVILEGMKFVKKKPGLVKLGGDYVYPIETLEKDFEWLKQEAHKHGLVFLVGENRLRAMGDSLTCCGCDGLEGFRPNKYNLAHLMNGDKQEPTPKMKEKETGAPFRAIYQDTIYSNASLELSFEDNLAMLMKKKRVYVDAVLGK